MTEYYSTSCTCPTPAPVAQDVKKKLCTVAQPLMTEYCMSTKNPQECENMARIACMETQNVNELFHVLNKVSQPNKPCDPCVCNTWN